MPDSDAPQRYRIDDLTLDVGRRVLERGGERITLTSRLFALLRVLAEGSPNVLSHDELADRAWGPRRVVTPENISQHIALLRRALGDDAASPRYIEAIRGEGYRLIPEVVPAAAPGRRRRRWPAAAGLSAIVGTVFVAGWLLGPEALDSPSLGIVEGSRAVEEPAQAADPRSLLVLPFASQSTEAEHGYFADGLSEELINRLSRIEGLLVMGRTTSFAVRASGVDAQAIGAMTGVANILEGSVRRSGDRVRIAVQLVRTADGYQIWSQAYDRGLDDVLAVQRDIAAAVADSLQATLSDETLANEFYGLPGTGNAEAYDLYLRAQGLLRASSP
ncbi:MAG: winged helix-turn-helix domain-containing protein, partial [Gammaproteobacteria bacterium]